MIMSVSSAPSSSVMRGGMEGEFSSDSSAGRSSS